MRVKVNGHVFDSTEEPIVIVLSKEDKRNIANMLPQCHKYCSYPDGHDEQEIKKFMHDLRLTVKD